MKESEGDRLKYAVYESTLSTAGAVPLPQWGRQRGGGFAAQEGSQTRLAALGSPFQGKGLAWTLPPSYGRRCPEGAEVGWGKRYPRNKAFPAWGRWRAKRAGYGSSGMKESGKDRLKSTIYESTLSTAGAVPLPRWGRQRNENTAIPEIKPSPRGEGGERSEPDRVLAA